jgi:prefoldin subunit 5
MSPIITHEDELELADTEEDVVDKIEDLAKRQKKVIKAQKKLADRVADMNIARESLNRTLRDALKQMQTLNREKKSNIKEKDVKMFQDLVHDNESYIENNKKYLNAVKDLAVRKEYFVEKKYELAEALEEVADKRETVIKKALDVEKSKNKMIEGDKMIALDNELNDAQRSFDRAHEILMKKMEQLNQARKEINDLWAKIKETINDLS